MSARADMLRAIALRKIAGGGAVHHNTSYALYRRGLIDAPLVPYTLTDAGRAVLDRDSVERGAWVTPLSVSEVIRRHRFRYRSEDELQEGLAAALTERFGDRVKREVRLDARSRADLMIDQVLVEVKVDGSLSDLARQVRRYARHRQVAGIVVVTNRVRHANVPVLLEGKPVRIVVLAAQL